MRGALGTNFVELQIGLFKLPPRGIFNVNQVIHWLISDKCDLPDFRKSEIKARKGSYATSLRNLMDEIEAKENQAREKEYRKRVESGEPLTGDFHSCLTEGELKIVRPLFSRDWQNGRSQIRFYAGFQFMYAAYLSLRRKKDELPPDTNLGKLMWFGPDYAVPLVDEFHEAVKRTKHAVIREGAKAEYMEHFRKVAADFAAGNTEPLAPPSVGSQELTDEEKLERVALQEMHQPEKKQPFVDPHPSNDLPGETEIVRAKPALRNEKRQAEKRRVWPVIKIPSYGRFAAFLALSLLSLAATARVYSYLSTRDAVQNWNKGKDASPKIVKQKNMSEPDFLKTEFYELWDLVNKLDTTEEKALVKARSLLQAAGPNALYHKGRGKLGMGVYFLNQNQHERAVGWLTEAASLFNLANKETNVARCELYLVEAFWFLGEFEEASSVLSSCLDRGISVTEPDLEYWQGRLAFKNKDYLAAIEHTERADNLWKDIGYNRQRVRSQAALSIYYSLLGRRDMAFNALVNARRFRTDKGSSEDVPLELAEFFLSVALTENSDHILLMPSSENTLTRLKFLVKLTDLKETSID